MAPPAIIAPREASPEIATPYRKSTVSAPSRSTATAITTSTTDISRAPLITSLPIFFAFSASSRPWMDIQMLCQASITTAMPRIEALKSSCPMPSASWPICSAPNATRIDPSRPAPNPPTM